MKAKQLKFKNLDELMEFNEDQAHDIHLHTFKFLRQEWNKNKKFSDIDLFNVDFEDDEEYDNIVLTIYSTEWVKALELCLEYFVEQEEYETCAQIRNLLIKIKNKKK
jgi:predicted nucleotidyltransferase